MGPVLTAEVAGTGPAVALDPHPHDIDRLADDGNPHAHPVDDDTVPAPRGWGYVDTATEWPTVAPVDVPLDVNVTAAGNAQLAAVGVQDGEWDESDRYVTTKGGVRRSKEWCLQQLIRVGIRVEDTGLVSLSAAQLARMWDDVANALR